MVCLMVNPTMEYMRAVEDLLPFVACTTHYGLCKVKGASELKLIGYRRTTMMTRPMILMNAKAFVSVLASTALGDLVVMKAISGGPV